MRTPPPSDQTEEEARIQATFDVVAEGYDHPSAAWFDKTAHAIVRLADLRPGMEVLDLATGTGKVALALAEAEPEARVLGIDLSHGMLARARDKASTQGLTNVSFAQGTFDTLAYGERFDLVTCSFGIFFVSRMEEALSRLLAQTRPAGRVIASTFAWGAFSPFTDAFMELYREYGFPIPPAPWLRIASAETFTGLFRDAGMPATTVREYDFGFALPHPEAWWEIVYNAGYRGLLQRLSPENAPTFKERHLAQVSDLLRAGQRHLDVRVLIAEGTKG